jgi:hypothetical protein
MKEDILRLAEGHSVAPQQRKCRRETDRFEFAVNGVGIEFARLFSKQAEHDSAIGAMACAGERERAVEIGMDFNRGWEEPARLELQQEGACCAHGTHGVRAGGSDADFVEIEQRGFHDWLW